MKITIVDGHPDDDKNRFCHALADAYASGAQHGGHEVRRIQISKMNFPILKSRDDWEKQEPSEVIREAQELLAWADHLVFIYPLWLGDLPAYFKAFLEQVARPKFAFTPEASMQNMRAHALKGKSAHIIVTMGMPGWFYSWVFGAHSLKSFKRNILGFVGIKPIRQTVIGAIESTNHDKWLAIIRKLGEAAQ